MKDIVDQCAENADGFVDWFFKLCSGAFGNKGTINYREIRLKSATKAVFNALEFLYDWLAIKQKKTWGKENNAIERTPTEWRKPQYPFLKCNVDVAFFTETRSMGFGMVVRDTEGKCIGCRSMVMEGLYEVKEGEAMELREALSWIREMNFNQVMFEMDAQIIVKAITSTKVENLILEL
ncbi:uncharacterized protein LOC142542052 [Primulina tabacum]|uniref:uncharacterized protein LOC142542052 n=1 Tax=Primulina tabacum TaxID=48773 RepID=UPI003F5A66C4